MLRIALKGLLGHRFRFALTTLAVVVLYGVADNTEQLRRTLRDLDRMPEPWQEMVGLSDRSFRLTLAEAQSLRRELEEVVARYRADVPEERGEAPADAERVVLISYLLPELELDDNGGNGNGEDNGDGGER
jgi:hypothetical protein